MVKVDVPVLEVTVMFTANPEKDLVGIGALYAFIDRKMVAGAVAAVDFEAIRLVPFIKCDVHLAIPPRCAGGRRTKVSNDPGAFVVIETGECLPLYDTCAKCILVTRAQSVLHAVMGVKIQAR